MSAGTHHVRYLANALKTILSIFQVVQHLKSGGVLSCPDNTPKSAYKVMASCWAPRVADRPGFRTLLRELETIERELVVIRRHYYRSQKSVVSMAAVSTAANGSAEVSAAAAGPVQAAAAAAAASGRNTPQSPKSVAPSLA